jgi:hypothetical protein
VIRPVLAVALALAFAAPARAASVRVGPGDPYVGGSELVYAAGPGETNRVTVAGIPTGTILVADAGAPLVAGSGCTALDAYTASCAPGPDGPLTAVTATLGDGADLFGATTAPGHPWDHLAVNGGPGDDVISAAGVRTASLSDRPYGVEIAGGPGRDYITGSPDADDLAGGGGRDVIRGLAGDDVLDGDGTGEAESGFDVAAPDVLDGGRGADTVSYATHRHGVVVDLARPSSAGARGEHDRLASIENVIGSAYSDDLRGARTANILEGWRSEPFARRPRGGDRIAGRGGNDVLIGSGRADVFDGGPGADVIELRGGRDVTACGPGTDAVDPGTTALLLPPDCERLDDGSFTFAAFHVAGGRLLARLTPDVSSAVCPEEITLRAYPRGPVYGHIAWSATPPAQLAIPLGAAGRRAARRHRLSVAREQGCTGSPSAWLIRLAPKPPT